MGWRCCRGVKEVGLELLRLSPPLLGCCWLAASTNGCCHLPWRSSGTSPPHLHRSGCASPRLRRAARGWSEWRGPGWHATCKTARTWSRQRWANGGLRAERCQLPLTLWGSAQAGTEATAAHLRLQDLALRLGYRPGACATTVHLLVPCLATSRMSISSSCSSEWLWVSRGQGALRGYRELSGAAKSTCQAPWHGRWRCSRCSRAYAALPCVSAAA
jgi:hypothetical protein